MNAREINETINELAQNMYALEDEFCENGGEVTESTEAREAVIAELKELLAGEGIDSLGRWLKSKEDRKKALKAEKDSITRQINATDKSIAYIKQMVNEVLYAAGVESAKGTCYKFSRSESVKTEVDKEVLKGLFQDAVETILRDNGIIPEDVSVTLGASISKLPEGANIPDYYIRTSSPTCKFVKPRESKTKEGEE